jgi:hypothetical protein
MRRVGASAIWSLSGEKRTWRGQFETVAIDPLADIGFAGEVQPRRTFNQPPTQEILSLLLAVKPRPQAPVSPSLALSLMSASALPTPARFRRLGPPMFDSPRIAS